MVCKPVNRHCLLFSVLQQEPAQLLLQAVVVTESTFEMRTKYVLLLNILSHFCCLIALCCIFAVYDWVRPGKTLVSFLES